MGFRWQRHRETGSLADVRVLMGEKVGALLGLRDRVGVGGGRVQEVAGRETKGTAAGFGQSLGKTKGRGMRCVRSVWKREPGVLDVPLRPGERSRDCGAGPGWPGGGRALGRPAPEGPPMSLTCETSHGVAGSPSPRPSGGGNSESEMLTRVGTPHHGTPAAPGALGGGS